MNTKLYFDNLATVITETEIADLFSTYGNVPAVHIALDRANLKSRGFGFVRMATVEGAQAAVQALNGTELAKTTLTVREALPQETPAGRLNERPSPRRSNSRLY